MKRLKWETYKRILIPVFPGILIENALAAASLIASPDCHILLLGLIHIPDETQLSNGALPAQDLRKTLQQYYQGNDLNAESRVIVTVNIPEAINSFAQEEKTDLIITERTTLDKLIKLVATPPCSLAIVQGPIPININSICLPVRGGPYAELALRISLTITQHQPAMIKAIHLVAPNSSGRQEAAFRGIAKIIAYLPEVNLAEIITDQPAQTILEQSKTTDLLVMGLSARQQDSTLGSVTEMVFNQSPCAVIAVKNMSPLPRDWNSEFIGQKAISILVDKWFAENTYHVNEFENLRQLVALKEQQGVKISLALPALNEEETVGHVIETVKKALMDDIPLLDEMILIDSNSSDRTREIAADLGLPVYIHQEILPSHGPRHGKGEALWKSLYLTHGDIILWIDTDILNIMPHFVYGLVGPFLKNPRVQFVKGFYRRPIRVGEKLQEGGGRVTELTARPLLNLFYPELSGIIQPLAGEYGGRRSALEQLPFFSGYGVEIGLLIGLFEKYGLEGIAQVDLQERIHRNQPLEALSKMSFAITQTVVRKLENRYQGNFLEDVNKTMKLIRHEPGRFFLEVQEIAEMERPPMLEIPEYREEFKR